MNKSQIKTIDKIIGDVELVKPKIESLLDEVRELMENLQSFVNGVEEDFDSKSEKWQESEKGQDFSANISELSNALREVEELESTLSDFDTDTIITYLDESKGSIDF